MQLYDEIAHELLEVELRPRMSVYVCGITPYDSAHLGHAFTYVHFDVLVRYLRHLGVEVTHVQNVTDVDDDILRAARERGIDYLELADREVASFERSMRAIGVAAPDHSPRATRFVPDIVREVAGLLASRRAYQREGTVYFRVSSDPGFGRLSGLGREEMLKLSAERGGHPDDPNKDDPLDFVLWQVSVEGEPWWESPWGRGRPGWHIECSTMARVLLGQPVDFHGGGSDLVFPHHECELAQAEAVLDLPFVRRWLHTATVYQDGEKMSKSLGNLTFVHDLLERFDPAVIRSFLLRRHYRQDFAWLGHELDHAQVWQLPAGAAREALGEATLRDAFYGALDNDLDTPMAMRVLDFAAGSDRDEDLALFDKGRALLGLDL